MCVQVIDISASLTFELWATSHTYPTCWSRQTTFADIQEPPSDLLRRRRPLPASMSCGATSCGERPLAASDLLRRATSARSGHQGRIDLVQIDQIRIDRGRIYQGRIDQGRIDQIRIDQDRIDQVDQGRIDRGRIDRGRIDQGRMDQDRIYSGYP